MSAYASTIPARAASALAVLALLCTPIARPIAAQGPVPIPVPERREVALELPGTTGSDTTAARRGVGSARELESFLDGLMAAHMEDYKIAGAVVSVVKDGQLLLAKGYGYADRDARKPVDPERTLFRIGSISKLFTWIAVMQLVEQGKLDLDRNVNEYLDFAIPDSYRAPITLRHLLTHTPGFEDRGAGLFAGRVLPRGPWLRDNMPARVRPPGTFAAYSNYGTALAGYIVERVAGMPWEQYVDRHILEPLGMEHTTAHEPLPARLQADMSQGYRFEGGDRLTPQEFEIIGPSAPAGSISASGTDMARFMIANLQHGRLGDARILADSTMRWMHRRVFTHDERIPGFGLGFYEKSANGVRIVGHGGDTQWFHSDMAIFPEENLGVFVSYNSQRGGELSFGPFLSAFLDQYYPQERGAADSLGAEELERYAGSYRVNRGSYTTFEKAAGLFSNISVAPDPEIGGLLMNSPFGPQRLVPVGRDLFRELHGSSMVAFRRGEDGRVTHAFMSNAPMLALERLAWYEVRPLHWALLGVAVLLFLVTLVAAPTRWVLARRFRELGAVTGQARQARWVAVAVAALYLVFLIGLAVVMSDIEALLTGQLGALRGLLALPVLAALLTLAMIFFAVQAWRHRWWGRWGRVHYTAVTVAAIGMAAVLGYWRLLGWHF